MEDHLISLFRWTPYDKATFRIVKAYEIGKFWRLCKAKCGCNFGISCYVFVQAPFTDAESWIPSIRVTYIHTHNIHIYIHACLHTYVHAYIHT
jgi:hypothetical protein